MGTKRNPAELAGRLNARLERFMPVITPGGILLGFLFPGVFIRLRPLITLFFALMTLSGALKLRAGELGLALRRPPPVLLFFVSAHLVLPLLGLFASGLFFPGDADTVAGFVLLLSAPTAVSGFIWVGIFRGDPALTLSLILLDTLAAPLLMPGTVSLLLGTAVSVDVRGMALSLVFMVLVPTVIGVFLNEVSRGKVPDLVSPYLNPLAKLFMALVIAANASAVAPRLRFDDPGILLIALLCVILIVLGFAVSKLAGLLGRLGREGGISLFFGAGLRNISAATTIAIEYFPEAAALPAILGIVFQQTLAALMGRLFLG
jgi:predicted Na+-dependent transporter